MHGPAEWAISLSMSATLVALALGPGLLLLHLLYVADRQREPVWNVLRYVIGGGIAVFVASWVETTCGIPEWLPRAQEAPLGFMVAMIVGVGAVEEGCKLIALVRRGWRDPALDEPFDWVVYSVAVALGFATLENILYVAEGGMQVAIMRALTAVPMHALCGTMMGWRLARATTNPAAATRERWFVFLEPMLWHGAYDVLAGFVHAGTSWAAPALLVVILAQWQLAIRRIAALRAASVVAGAPPLLMPETDWRKPLKEI